MTLFRVDFGEKTGFGHLKRTLVYAKNFNKVIYISKSTQKEFVPYPLKIIKNEEDFFKIVKKIKPIQVIIDNYNFTYNDEREFKKRFPKVKLSVFDDIYNEHFCDEIINHNIYAKKERYKDTGIVSIIPPLIGDEFKKEKNIKREKIYDILISLGGSDSSNLTLSILKNLSKQFKIVVLTTSINKNLDTLKEYTKDKQNIFLHIDSNRVAKLFNQSKFGIITPSVMAMEALFMQLPFMAIQTADNQKEMVEYLEKKSIRVLREFDKKIIKELIF